MATDVALSPPAARHREARIDAGLSQAELAARAGSAQVNVAVIEALQRLRGDLCRLLEAVD